MSLLRTVLRLAGAFALGVAVVLVTWLVVGVLGGEGFLAYVVGLLLPALAVSGLAWRRWRASAVTAAVVVGAAIAAGYLALLTYALEHLNILG